jgi:hypothetical protein
MTVKNGELADQTTFNTSFMSREEDTNTVGVVTLENAGSATIADAQQTINDNTTNIAANTVDIATNTGDILTINNSIGVANGIAELDGDGKVPASQLPTAGTLQFQGTWDASTNTPDLVTATKEAGFYWVVNVAGATNLDGITDWKVGDWAIYNGTTFQKIDNTDEVQSVNGQTGTVVLDADDISETATRKYDSVIHNRDAVVDPTVSNDNTEGYGIGSTWFNAALEKKFVAKSVGTGTAEWIEVSGGGGGGVGDLFTYYSNDFETTSASDFTVTGAAVVTDETTDPLYGSRSINIAHDAGDGASEIELDVSIDIQQGQQGVLSGLDLAIYSPTSGADGVYNIEIEESTDDVTYTSLKVSEEFTPISKTQIVRVYFTPNASSEYLRFKINIVTDTTIATEELYIDNLVFTSNPLTTVKLNNDTDWAVGTPNTLQGLGSITSDFFIWRRNGGNLEMMGSFITGTVTALELQVGFPTEAGNISASSNIGGRVLVGNWGNNNASADSFLPNTVAGDTFINLGRTTVSAGVANSMLNSSEFQSFSVSVPIEEWSAYGEGVVTDGELTDSVIVNCKGNGGESITANVTDVPFTVVTDSTGSFSGATFTAPSPGRYSFNGMMLFNASAVRIVNVLIGGATFERVSQAITDSNIKFTTVLDLESEDQVTFREIATGGTLTDNDQLHYLKINKLNSGAKTIISPFKTEITAGTEYKTGEVINSKDVYEYVYEVTSDITSTATIASNPVGIVDPVGHLNATSTLWDILRNYDGANTSYVYYNTSTGNIEAFIGGAHKVGAGTIIRFKYTK